MVKPIDLRRQDVSALARDGATVRGLNDESSLLRLADEAAPERRDFKVSWSAHFSTARDAASSTGPWLDLTADSVILQTCQRCLMPVEVGVVVDRRFRFAADEATAALEDEASEEDVLSGAHEFDLLALVEDELLMALPLVPQHDICPQPLVSADDPSHAVEPVEPHPFAVLEALKRRD